jgi:hypothetical protein
MEFHWMSRSNLESHQIGAEGRERAKALNRLMKTENWETNAAAYATLEGSLDILRPKIIVVCNCDHGAVEDGLPPYLCSSVERAGETEFVQLPNEHQCIKVSSFHPMYIERTNPDQRPERIMREYLFDTCLVVAAQLLVGRTILGFGILNIRHAAIRGPIIVPGRGGPTLSYKCATKVTPRILL